MKDYIWGLGLKALKRWTRSGLIETTISEISKITQPNVLSIGGFGPVDTQLKAIVQSLGGKYLTLDVETNHSPEIIGDVENIEALLLSRKFVPDVIVALEVLEHVPNTSKAIHGIHNVLPSKGVFILSVPWIIPIHDRPFDFYRFTPAALQRHLSEFESCRIIARGNYYDSVVALLLRGLFTGRHLGKFLLIIGMVLSSISMRPRIYDQLDHLDSCIGYMAISRKH
jgi:hypothetical protein